MHGSTATITVGRGTKSNALDGDAWRLLKRHLWDIGSQESIRVVVLSGRGETFCAGSDTTEWVGAASDAVEQSFALMEAAFRAVERCPVPVVAKITGAAAGAGCQLALACALRIMATSARIGMPIARLGILPSPSFAARMVELAGPSVARELLYTGRLLDAPAAVAAGLANRCVADDRLTEETDRLAEQVAAQPPAAIRAAKQAVTAVLRPGRAAGEETDQRAVSEVDFQRGITEFLRRS
ncbi:MAG: enoyl-CoA hydratase/isomerase family protein [Sciscionella sp.]